MIGGALAQFFIATDSRLTILKNGATTAMTAMTKSVANLNGNLTKNAPRVWKMMKVIISGRWFALRKKTDTRRQLLNSRITKVFSTESNRYELARAVSWTLPPPKTRLHLKSFSAIEIFAVLLKSSPLSTTTEAKTNSTVHHTAMTGLYWAMSVLLWNGLSSKCTDTSKPATMRKILSAKDCHLPKRTAQ